MSHNRHRYNRRAFLSKSLSGAASLGLVGMSPKVLSLKNPVNKKIIHRQLGKTGIKLPVVSMGITRADIIEIIKASYKIGVRYFSTVHWYAGGLCEKILGNAINDLGVREHVLLATKVPTGRHHNGTWQKNIKDLFLERFFLSMERLQTDYLDILYLYNIDSVEEISKPELLEALTELKQQKKIRFVGFSTHSDNLELLNKAAEMNFYDVVAVAFNYTMFENKALIKALENAAQKGIGLVAMKTQCGAAWGVDGYRKPKEQSKNQTAMLKWILRHNFISTAIPAIEAFDHVNEDFSVAYDLEYTAKEKRFLDDENIRYSIGFCQQCQKCVATCPKGIDIPTLMRIHMYAYQYQNMDLVNLAQKEMDASNGISHCRNCDECKAVCFNSVPISQNISALKKLNWSQYA